MSKEFGKLCAKIRNSAGFTQESAAERLSVSTRSLSAYESGKTSVPDDVMGKMVEVYQAPILGYQYLRMTNVVGAAVLPPLEWRQLSSSILDLQVKLKKTNDIQYDMAEVGADNKISADEAPVFRNCIKQVKALIGAAFSVTLCMPPTKEK